ncbi:uncharacterized protein MELLADRAFT_89945 [Melampsora larici-populina 98AG31]|uniref:Uncharacterized protein n=1 Tax=Melampsora larici-populina (strain 98AG31 / pathotype 3-4-7) TaxID=747676 RepID=F4RV71_MELLP|nr:uncharacterized protein MELLADRAFT_89945 [Melampsora larici-populina 98AG31]EGG03571.1 hypothetical protein MELLADRAFT_89945 [Melampsora larici-populina 98AG31]
MPACRCSNCEPEASKLLAANMKWLTLSNFEAGLKNPDILAKLGRQHSNNDELNKNEEAHDDLDPDAPIINPKPNGPPLCRVELMQLVENLTLTIKEHHRVLMDDEDRLKASDYIDDNDIWRVLNKIYTIETYEDVYEILGCDILPGGVAKIVDCINEWKSGDAGSQALSNLRAREAATRLIQAETLARLQKQHEEREAKARESRILIENKRKQNTIDRLAETEAKRQRKEESLKRRTAATKAKSDQVAKRAANSRMIAALASGKSMEEVEVAEERIRRENSDQENKVACPNANTVVSQSD